MRKKEVCFLVLVFLVIFLYGCPAEEGMPPEESVTEKKSITREDDVDSFPPTQDVVFMVPRGDTLIFPFGNETSLIGIKSPERGEPCFEESRDRLKELVLDKEVTLQRDVSDMDYYSRYLRYVFVDGLFVNEVMVREGLAKFVNSTPDTKYSDLFYAAEVDAASNRLCLWKDLEADPCLLIAFFNYDAEGVDEFNLNDEFVTFRNICKAPFDLTDWTIEDSVEMYKFSEFVLGPEAAVTLHSGKGQDTKLHLYWGSELSVWDDESDTLYLRNPNGNLIIKHHY